MPSIHFAFVIGRFPVRVEEGRGEPLPSFVGSEDVRDFLPSTFELRTFLTQEGIPLMGQLEDSFHQLFHPVFQFHDSGIRDSCSRPFISQVVMFFRQGFDVFLNGLDHCVPLVLFVVVVSLILIGETVLSIPVVFDFHDFPGFLSRTPCFIGLGTKSFFGFSLPSTVGLIGKRQFPLVNPSDYRLSLTLPSRKKNDSAKSAMCNRSTLFPANFGQSGSRKKRKKRREPRNPQGIEPQVNPCAETPFPETLRS